MKMRRYWVLAVAVLLAAALSASAASDSTLGAIYNAGKTLLFDTDNVTLTGTADFALDGENFKKVQAKYVQDGATSMWDYKLTSPMPNGTGEKESGYTVYANNEATFTVDRSYPGTFRNGFGEAQDTLVRRSALMDQAVELAGAAIAAMEPLLPENAVQIVTENHTGREVRVTLDEDSVSGLTNTAFNLCAQMVIRRAIERVDFDYAPTAYIPFEDFLTPAKAIVSCTERYDLAALDVTAVLDGNSRLRSLKGSMTVRLKLLSGTVAEGEPTERKLDVSFNISISDYNTSHLEFFDPEAAGLELQWHYD